MAYPAECNVLESGDIVCPYLDDCKFARPTHGYRLNVPKCCNLETDPCMCSGPRGPFLSIEQVETKPVKYVVKCEDTDVEEGSSPKITTTTYIGKSARSRIIRKIKNKYDFRMLRHKAASAIFKELLVKPCK